MKTLITGGTVVNATGRGPADVLIDGETIVALLQPGSTALGVDLSATVDRVIDATGKYVIPGGIDAHTHMEMPFGGTFASDTFETGTTAAAWGGTTTIVDFVVQYAGENPLEQYALCFLLGGRTDFLRMSPRHGHDLISPRLMPLNHGGLVAAFHHTPPERFCDGARRQVQRQ